MCSVCVCVQYTLTLCVWVCQADIKLEHWHKLSFSHQVVKNPFIRCFDICLVFGKGQLSLTIRKSGALKIPLWNFLYCWNPQKRCPNVNWQRFNKGHGVGEILIHFGGGMLSTNTYELISAMANLNASAVTHNSHAFRERRGKCQEVICKTELKCLSITLPL